MTQDKPSLDSLRIARKADAPGGRPWAWILLVVLLLAAAGGAAWSFWPPQGIPVQAATAQALAGAASTLDATGYVVARRQSTLSAKILGKLVTENIEEGQHVKAGELVARLDDSNFHAALVQAIEQERQGQVQLNDVEAIYARYQRLHNQGAISTDAFETQRQLYDTVRAQLAVDKAAVAFAQTNEDDTFIRAPYAGVVTDKAAQVGEIVAPAAAGGGFTRTGIATLVDMDSLEIDVDVSENYIERVHAGGAATIHLEAYPDLDIPGSVIAVVPTADQTKGTVKVRIAVLKKDPHILPQMGARVSFLTSPQRAGAPRGVMLPANTVKTDGATGKVYVLNDDGTVEERTVRLGLKTAQTITVLSGLTAGERVAVANFAKLHDGVRVTVNRQ